METAQEVIIDIAVAVVITYVYHSYKSYREARRADREFEADLLATDPQL